MEDFLLQKLLQVRREFVFQAGTQYAAELKLLEDTLAQKKQAPNGRVNVRSMTIP